ncbi:alpha/beta hydrolase [Calderihabitans maritimus]|uniref:Carboxylesterase n=1 Tax=Calderihabitans maritimus TaxID=1246530 RepID=A0A1Z5HPH6_9FIRM|nr:alpha/beta fold hydrolase [Calderihabitans maritimus]GAW91429.1 carboxylesterase [Calderihabitans maritimus]
MKAHHHLPEPFFFEGDNRGLLLVHGFTGSTAELRPMGKYFRDLGYTVHAPLLAGHGTTPEDMKRTSWPDWWSSVVQGYQHLVRSGCNPIYAAGLSMGGLLVLKLSLQYEVAAIATMSSPVYIKDRRAYLTPLLKRIIPYIRKEGRDEKPPYIKREVFLYDRIPLACVSSLLKLIGHVKRKLPEINVPVFIAQSGKDEVVDPRSACYLYRHIGSNCKELKWYPESTHIITLDIEKERLFTDLEKFFKRYEHLVK